MRGEYWRAFYLCKNCKFRYERINNLKDDQRPCNKCEFPNRPHLQVKIQFQQIYYEIKRKK